MTEPDWSIEHVDQRRRNSRRAIAWFAIVGSAVLAAVLVVTGDAQRKNRQSHVTASVSIPDGTVVVTIEADPTVPLLSVPTSSAPPSTNPVTTVAPTTVLLPEPTPAPTAPATLAPEPTTTAAPVTVPSTPVPVTTDSPRPVEPGGLLGGDPQEQLPGGQQWPNGFVDGTVLYMRGAVPSEAVSQDLQARVEQVLGSSNVRNELVIDPAVPKVETVVVRFGDSVLFAENSAAIPEKYNGRFVLWAAFMQQNPDVLIRVTGHTDSRGTLTHNLQLANERAGAAAHRIVQFGGDPARLSVRAAGPNDPVDSNDTPSGRAKNRRIEFAVSGLFA